MLFFQQIKADLLHDTLHSVWKWANSVTISRFTCHRADTLQTDQQPTGKPSWALTDLINGIPSQPDSTHTSRATSPAWRVLQGMVTFSTDMKCSTYKPKAREGQRSPGGKWSQVSAYRMQRGTNPEGPWFPCCWQTDEFYSGTDYPLRPDQPLHSWSFRIKAAAKISATPGGWSCVV